MSDSNDNGDDIDIGDNTGFDNVVGNHQHNGKRREYGCTRQDYKEWLDSDNTDRLPIEFVQEIKSLVMTYLSDMGLQQSIVESVDTDLSKQINTQYQEFINNNNNQNNKNTPTHSTVVNSSLTMLSSINSLYHKSIPFRVGSNTTNPIRPFKKVKQQQPSTQQQQQPLNTSNQNIQITASKEELNKRIKTFSMKKKTEIQQLHSKEFKQLQVMEKNVLSGNSHLNDGLVDSSVIEGSRTFPIPPSRVKNTVVVNTVGPLSVSEKERESQKYTPFINERFDLIESQMGIVLQPIPKDLYQRIKVIEEKIFEIEQKNPTFFKDLYDIGNNKKKQKQNTTTAITSTTTASNISPTSSSSTITTNNNNNKK